MNTYCVVRSSRGVPIALQIAMGHGLFSDQDALDVLMTRCTAKSNGYPYACVGLPCEKPRRASVSNASLRHSWVIRVNGVAR